MRILFVDLETSPHTGEVWGKYNQNVLRFLDYSQIMSIAWKWYGENKVYAVTQFETKGYRAGRLHDKLLVKMLWDLFDKADVIIGHNGDKFDTKMANARFIYHNLPPPSTYPYKTVDTRKVARRTGMFPSNSLDDLSQYFGHGEKLDTGGKKLWENCKKGLPSAWRKMKRYNKYDVVLCERTYKELLPWIINHPNYNVYTENHLLCPNCGSHKTQRRGKAYTATGYRYRYKCMSCGKWAKTMHVTLNPVLR